MFSKWRQIGLITVGIVVGVMISINYSAVAQRSQTALPIEEMRAFTDVFEAIKRNYVEPVEDKKLFTEAINGMLTGLDPHSAYLDQDAFKELQVGTQGEFGGLGIEVGMEDGFVKVVAPIDDTPAARAGLKPGDLIIKLDETAVKGLSLNDAVKRMRGKPNSKITLTVVRKGEPAPFTVTLIRAIIKIQSVKFKLIEPDFGYVRISQFQEHTGEALASALTGLYKQNQKPLKGLVLDLRNDPGGLLNGAVAVSAAFLPQNSLVVYTDGRTEDAKMKLNASGEHYLRGRSRDDYLQKLPTEVKNVPMVVLVNGGSASASEIVAGALQDHKRATILGTQTFGKGSVQTIMPLGNNTAIKLTTARYYTPNGRSIQAKGITPDLIVEDPFNPSDQSLRMREADLGRHLLNDREGEAPAAPGAKPDASAAPSESNAQPAATPRPKPKPLAPGEIVSKDDFQVQQALNHLKGEKVVAKAP